MIEKMTIWRQSACLYPFLTHDIRTALVCIMDLINFDSMYTGAAAFDGCRTGSATCRCAAVDKTVGRPIVFGRAPEC
jgi:hypothetical protein